jgi:hypothetical protein
VFVSTLTREEGNEEKQIPFLKRYFVFNVDQVEGLPANLYAPPVLGSVEHLDTFLSGIRAEVRHGGPAAYYNRKEDYVQLRIRKPSLDGAVLRDPIMSSSIGRDIPVDWIGNSGNASAKKRMRSRNSLPNWVLHSSRPILDSLPNSITRNMSGTG